LPGALEGIRVVELGQMVSAPYCARLFAGFGADVIKVEPPAGDIARSWGPFPGDGPHPEKSGLFFFLNTDKRGVTLDPGVPADREVLLGLLQDADLFIENNAPSQMREWGLDYPSLAEINPDLVMVSITPFGQTGPYSEWKGYDLNSYHLSGAGSRYCGYPDREPLEYGAFAADFFGAVAGAAWGLGAMRGRENAGAGQHVDVSCAEVIAAVFVGGQNIGGYVQDGVFEKRLGVGMPLAAPGTILPCRDGHVWMLAFEPGQWMGLARAMGDPEWMHLDEFKDLFYRKQHEDAIYPLLRQWTAGLTKQEIMDACQANGCPSTAVYTVAEAVDHPHARERGYVVEVPHPALGRVRTLGAPARLAGSPSGPVRGAPLLGEHNGDNAWRAPGGTRHRAARSTGGRLPLEGLRVANFGWVWAGPIVGQVLGFLGAEVYKIESRARIDLNRMFPPFAEGIPGPDRSLQNHAGWAGNGSITLNLKEPAAQDLARRLVARCDVVIENFGPGAMEQFSLSYDRLRGVKPDIVMLSMPAAGLSGPLKDVRTYGVTLTSLTGLDSITGYQGGPPVPMENAFADPYNGILGAFCVLAALNYRDLTGKGQHIDLSQLEGAMQMVGPAAMDYFLNGRVAAPMGNRHPAGAGAPHGVFPCAREDRWVSIAVLTDAEWHGLVQAMGSPQWAVAAGLETAAGRLRNIDTLHERLAGWTRGYDDRELAARLQAHGVAAAPVTNVADLWHDPHFRERGTFVEVAHPLGFRETLYGPYVKLSRSVIQARPGPVMGRDNGHVFREMLGLSAVDYKRLQADRVIY
jgi:benzylsuccinate CoA-transferase BbsF subunit